MSEESNVVTFRDWLSKKTTDHTKKAMTFLGKAEMSLKEGKAVWGKKFAEMADKEIKIAARWQDRLNRYNEFENPPVEIVTNEKQPVTSDFAKWMRLAGHSLKQ